MGYITEEPQFLDDERLIRGGHHIITDQLSSASYIDGKTGELIIEEGICFETVDGNGNVYYTNPDIINQEP